jgi:hypothetical protein
MPADNLSVRQRFSEILEASRTQDRSKQSATMVVLSHLQQMTLLMIKKGLFFYCEQDTYKARTKFVEDLIQLNKLDIRFPAIVRNFLIDGFIFGLTLSSSIRFTFSTKISIAFTTT